MVFHRVEQAMQIQEQNLLYIISLLLVDICPGVGSGYFLECHILVSGTAHLTSSHRMKSAYVINHPHKPKKFPQKN